MDGEFLFPPVGLESLFLQLFFVIIEDLIYEIYLLIDYV